MADQSKSLEKVVKDFSNAVNTFTPNPDEFINAFTKEHRTLQQSMFNVMAKLICHMASDNYRTDDRNKSSKRLAENFLKGFINSIEEREITVLQVIGYTEEEAKVKAKKMCEDAEKNPMKYIGMPCI